MAGGGGGFGGNRVELNGSGTVTIYASGDVEIRPASGSRRTNGEARVISLDEEFGDVVVQRGGVKVELNSNDDVTVYTSGDVKVRPAVPGDAGACAPKIGEKMPDGTVYLGISPETGKPFYATAADESLTMVWTSSMADLDHRVRLAAFQLSRSPDDSHGETLPREVLATGFLFEGTRVPLLEPMACRCSFRAEPRAVKLNPGSGRRVQAVHR